MTPSPVFAEGLRVQAVRRPSRGSGDAPEARVSAATAPPETLLTVCLLLGLLMILAWVVMLQNGEGHGLRSGTVAGEDAAPASHIRY